MNKKLYKVEYSTEEDLDAFKHLPIRGRSWDFAIIACEIVLK